MGRVVEAMAKIRNSDAASVLEATTSRLKDVFSRVRTRKIKDGTFQVKGGSIFQPYGFVGKVTLEEMPDNAVIMKLSARPAMNLMSWLAALLILVMLIFGLNNVINGFWGLILAFVMILAAISAQKAVARKLENVAKDIQLRFS